MLRTVMPVRRASSSMVSSSCVTSVTSRGYTFECDMDRCNIEACTSRPSSPSPPPASRPSAPPREPAGGAAIGRVILATSIAAIATAGLLWLVTTYRSRRGTPLERIADFSERVSGLPSWAALPAGVAGGALLIALLGMYWDISLHIDNGRDPGPLANPAHYLILIGLYGVCASGVLAVAPRK